MSDNGERLREAFTSHEHLAPDAAAVYERVLERAKVYKRRRRGAQMAAGGVLGAGLVAGAINLPALLPVNAQSDNTPAWTSIQPAAGGPAPSSQPAPGGAGAPAPASASAQVPGGAPQSWVPDPNEPYWAAYFGAGYGYDEAVELAKLWNMTADSIGDVKAEAGRRLLAGETLPVAPSPDPSGEPSEPAPDPSYEARLNAFFNAGHDWDDAERLAELWNMEDPTDAKVEAGRRLLAGEELPL